MAMKRGSRSFGRIITCTPSARICPTNSRWRAGYQLARMVHGVSATLRADKPPAETIHLVTRGGQNVGVKFVRSPCGDEVLLVAEERRLHEREPSQSRL